MAKMRIEKSNKDGITSYELYSDCDGWDRGVKGTIMGKLRDNGSTVMFNLEHEVLQFDYATMEILCQLAAEYCRDKQGE